jgi:hypothetical protein
METGIQSLKDEIETLRQSNRRIKFGCTLGFVCLAALVSMGAQQGTPRSIEANEFILRDRAGNMRARLTSANGSPALAFYQNPDAMFPNVVLKARDDGGELSIYGSHEKLASLHLNNSGADLQLQGFEKTAVLSEEALSLAKGKQEHGLFGISDDGPFLLLSDKLGFETHLGALETTNQRTGEARTHSAASITMFGKDGKIIWSAP